MIKNDLSSKNIAAILLSLVLAAFIAVTAVGCSGEPQKPAGPNGGDPQQETPADDAQTPEGVLGELIDNPCVDVMYLSEDNDIHNYKSRMAVYQDLIDGHCYVLRVMRYHGGYAGGLAMDSHMLINDDGVTPMNRAQVEARLADLLAVSSAL